MRDVGIAIGIGVGVLIVAALYILFWQSWWLLVVAGALLYLGTLFIGKKPAAGEQLMKIPDQWNEMEIRNAVLSARSNQNLLTAVLDRIADKFIMNQQIDVAEKRIEYLQTFLRKFELERQAYSWKRAIEDGRIDKEEDAKTRKVERDEEFAEVEHQARMAEAKARVAKAQREDQAYSAAEQTASKTEEQSRQENLNAVDRKISEVKREIQRVEQDGSLGTEDRTRKINRLRDRLDELEEERLRWL